MEISELKRIKEEKAITNKQLAELSGVPYGTITKIFCGVTKRPRADKIAAIENAIKNFIKDESGSLDLATWFSKETHTVDDWLNLPDDRRAELIDGVFYDMASPSIWHQRVVGLVYFLLLSYVKEKGGKCLPLLSPIGIQLDRDDKTVVEPDVVIVCNPDKVQDRIIHGAPDWIMEVVSPSTKKRDYIIKLNKYQNAGVREYWIVDKDQTRVTVYTNLDNPNEMQIDIYSFTDKIPVGIYDDLLIDMSEVLEY
ncbi:MAG: Uma2 family endonuclease [Pseudobutyrivibrio sp.]|nr:Uma2 family endonuclease [Pseudobutyrivibrio sp.]